jgi:uncharacterized membrane protein
MQESPTNVRLSSRGIQGFGTQQLKNHPLTWMIGATALILFLSSSLRHALFNSTGWDLGIYDQVVYLISQGKQPFSSFLQMHHLGNHAAWSVYALALLYKIYPSVYWLLLVQAVALSLGALPIWHLARLAGLREGQALAMSAVYLLYPVVYNTNLFDFHPEVMGVPVLIGAILAACLGRVLWFTLAILFVLGCKAVLSLTVTAVGFWLLVFEKKRVCGAIALIAGIGWFIIVTQLVIPGFSGEEAAAVSRYSYLGDSVLEIVKNLFLKPGPIFKVVFSLDNLKYLILLFAPVIWGLSPQTLTPLVPAVPALALNLLADYQPQKDIVAQYSLPIVPFLVLAVIATLADGRGWLRKPRWIVLWSLIFFLGLARWSYFFTKYLPTIDTWQANREAIALIQTKGGVYTTNEIAPHLSERPLIERTVTTEPHDLTKFDYVLLNKRHPGTNSSKEFAAQLVEQLQRMPQFKLRYQRDDVYLFQKVDK